MGHWRRGPAWWCVQSLPVWFGKSQHFEFMIFIHKNREMFFVKATAGLFFFCFMPDCFRISWRSTGKGFLECFLKGRTPGSVWPGWWVGRYGAALVGLLRLGILSRLPLRCCLSTGSVLRGVPAAGLWFRRLGRRGWRRPDQDLPGCSRTRAAPVTPTVGAFAPPAQCGESGATDEICSQSSA